MTEKKRVAYFGGTFDPVHAGHIGLARAVLDRGAADLVVFSPAYAPPHKRGRKLTPFVHRFNMLALALKKHPGILLSDVEARRGVTPSYTVDVLRFLRDGRPDWRWQLLIGADSLTELAGWYEAAALNREFAILTAPRPGVSIDAALLRRQWGGETARELLRNVLDLPLFCGASTEIRKNFREAVVLPEIRPYIELCGLYRSGDKHGEN